jgi:hypothetical protein
MAGPKPNSSVDQALPPDWIGTALISTLLSIRKDSKSGPTKTGSVVVNVLAVRGGSWLSRSARDFGSPLPGAATSLPGGGQVTGAAKRPSMLSPLV